MNDVSKIVPGWRAWLPESALGWAGGDQLLADVSRHWSAKWFARRSVRPSLPLAEAPALPAEASLVWSVLGLDAAIGVTKSGRDRLAMLMLGENRPVGDIAGSDRRVLDRMIEDALTDLCRRLGDALGFAPDARWRSLGNEETPLIERPRLCRLDVDTATPLVHIALATDLLIARAKARAARASRPRPLQSIAAALATQKVSVSAALGRCSLSLADLAGLGVGDVLLLDRTTDTPLSLALDGTAARRGLCAVERDGDRLHLRLLEPLTA